MAAVHSIDSSTSKLTPPVDPKLGTTDKKVVAVRDAVLGTIRTSMPIDTLFRPELKINLGVFISDQILFHEIGAFLQTLPPGSKDKAAIAQHFREHPVLKAYTPPLLDLFYEACLDVLKGNTGEDRPLQEPIGGRIFTLKNALFAQHTPEAIQATQAKHGLNKKSKETIQREGADFVRRCIALHMGLIARKKEAISFKEELKMVTDQLVPFVEEITKSYMTENSQWTDCPSDPLRFRNPTGYNRHGLIAATVMEAALQALGYQTQFMVRSDLDPRATLATAHGVIAVTGSDGKKHMVDPTHLQFLKDIRTPADVPLADPVLILREDEVPQYVETAIMPYWKETRAQIQAMDPKAIQAVKKHDQLLAYALDRQDGLPPEVRPTDMEHWIRESLTRPWDLRSYQPVLSNRGYQEIFNGVTRAYQKTFHLIEPMGISPLTSHIPLEEIKGRLDTFRGEKNSPELLGLIAQLPKIDRAKYAGLLDIDQRTKELDPCINAYFRSVKGIVNPEGRDFSVVYGCSGADATSVLESTDASELFFVDSTKATFETFERVLLGLQDTSDSDIEGVKNTLQEESLFLEYRRRYSGGVSTFKQNEGHFMTNLPLKLFLDLRAIGVDLQKARVTELENGVVQVDFPWEYFGSSRVKNRSLTFITADITDPATYPPFSKDKDSRNHFT